MSSASESKLQDQIFQAMSAPDFYPQAAPRVETRDTHISKVFLAGDLVYKVKKAVSYDFLDYSTLQRRLHYCREEIKLNRRLAPDIYLDVVTITQDNQRFCLNGAGRAVEYAVMMKRLPEECTLRMLLRRKRLGSQAVEDLARRLCEFYETAAFGPSIDAFGSIEAISENCEENFRLLPEVAEGRYDADQLQIIRSVTRAFLLRRRVVFEDRIKAAKIRDCHGDLRCGHIYFTDGIQVVDCIEFNDRFRYSDVACDLAYLIMDLEYEGFSQVAKRVLDEYVRLSNDQDVYVLLDFYKCYRAMVKSKVSFIASRDPRVGEFKQKRLADEGRRYLSMAYDYAIRFTRPTIWVVFGLPASGKSTIAKRLSSILHIDLLRSDQVRKEIFGLSADKEVTVPFEEGIYSPGSTALTYGRLLLAAQAAVEQGRSVILDATFSHERQRRDAMQLARDTDANIVFIECVASVKCIQQRLVEREKRSSVSDARVQHLADLMQRFEPAADIHGGLHLRVDTEAPLEESIQHILAHDYYQRSPGSPS